MEIHKEEVKTSEKKKRIVRLGRFLAARPELILQCVFAVFIFLLGTYRLDETYIPILYNDEYGYWAASAFFMGDDWSSVTSRIPYYSYGYGLLLVPLRFLYFKFGWTWWELYRSGVILNTVMLIGSYFIACKLCKRFMGQMGRVVRCVVCFVAVIYSTNIVYSHITWTENALYFFFWVLLYVLMRCIDQPSMKNHAFLALAAFYIYTIHQRAVAELIAIVLIVLYMRLRKANALMHTAAFFGSFYLCNLMHTMIKGKLQNDFYMHNPPADFRQTLSYALTWKALVLLLIFMIVMVILYLIDREKRRWLFYLMAASVMAAVICLFFVGDLFAGQTVDNRISVNDFAGQWEKVQGIFSFKGILRLLISLTGKWFYLASASGLIICWAMKDLVKHMFWTAVEGIRSVISWAKGTAYAGKHITAEHKKEDIWRLGVALCWIGTMLVSAIYKEGLYKVDDLLNGRYIDFISGILLVYSFYILLKDKHWIRTALICLVLYLLAGVLCQHTLNELQRTEFELSHSVMLGRIFWNWEVPVGKVRALAGYVLTSGICFLIVTKLFSGRFTDARVIVVRSVAGLLLPVLVWTHLSLAITDNYTVSVNSKHLGQAPDISRWISSLDRREGFPVYFLEDLEAVRWAEELQFALQENVITLTSSAEAPYEEDAFFIANKEYGNSPEVLEKCAKVIETSRFVVLVSRDQELMRRLNTVRGD